jgi:hypothetical protein
VITIFFDCALTFGDISAPALPKKLIAATASPNPGIDSSDGSRTMSSAWAATNRAVRACSYSGEPCSELSRISFATDISSATCSFESDCGSTVATSTGNSN